jgi:transcriptional regulator with XRE-family HTH domain
MGSAVKRRRAALGLRQGDVIERMDPPVGIETLRRVEAGDQPNYRLTTLAAVARALNWPADMLERIAHGDDPPDEEIDPARLDELDARLSRVEDRLVEILALLEGEGPS